MNCVHGRPGGAYCTYCFHAPATVTDTTRGLSWHDIAALAGEFEHRVRMLLVDAERLNAAVKEATEP